MMINLAQFPTQRSMLVLLLAGIVGIGSGCIADTDGGEEDGFEEPTAQAVEAIKWGNHDYLFFLSPLTWEQARSQCLANSYYLVSVNSSTEEIWLHQQQTAKGGGYWWIGYSDIGFEGVWVWEDGSQPAYTNWSSGDPSNSDGNEHCVQDNWPAGSGRWTDTTCTEKYKFICERNY